MILFHAVFILLIAATGYGVYDAWRRDAAGRSFTRRRQLLPFIPLWPKTAGGYIILYRLLLTVALLAALFVYARFLFQNY